MNLTGAGSDISLDGVDLAVLIPCHNEETTIATVVADFRAALPNAVIYVCDNASTDRTAACAAEAGAIVINEPLRGKGNAVWRLFADVEADFFLLVEGDDAYEAGAAPGLVRHCLEGRFDMVNGARVPTDPKSSRFGHDLGNVVLTRMVASTFGGHRFTDVLSGYHVFSRRFVKSFPALSSGFEIETEFTVYALELRMPVSEVPTAYRARPPGSSSKLRTYSDGLRILRTILVLLKEERPFQFFGLLAGLFALLSIGAGIPVVVDYVESGLVPRLPTAVLASALMLLAALSFACGLILDTVTRGRREVKLIRYLDTAGASWQPPAARDRGPGTSAAHDVPSSGRGSR